MKILISEKIDNICPQIFQDADFTVDIITDLSPEALANKIGEYDGLVVRSSTKVTADILARPGKLKVIGRAGAGVDTIDVEAASKAGILVMNTPGQNANGVAEISFGLMLALIRKLTIAHSSLKEGRWEKNKLGGTELRNKCLGLLGFGAIGKRMAAIAAGFEMQVIICDPLINPDDCHLGGVKPVCLDEVLEKSDFLSLHLPKTDCTTNIINAEALAKMKNSAILINCARGGLVDEIALADALKNGRLAGAAFDVFASEPPAADNPLLALDNFIASPHLGASTSESQINVAIAVAKQMIAFLQNGKLDGAVNPNSLSPA